LFRRSNRVNAIIHLLPRHTESGKYAVFTESDEVIAISSILDNTLARRISTLLYLVSTKVAGLETENEGECEKRPFFVCPTAASSWSQTVGSSKISISPF